MWRGNLVWFLPVLIKCTPKCKIFEIPISNDDDNYNEKFNFSNFYYNDTWKQQLVHRLQEIFKTIDFVCISVSDEFILAPISVSKDCCNQSWKNTIFLSLTLIRIQTFPCIHSHLKTSGPNHSSPSIWIQLKSSICRVRRDSVWLFHTVPITWSSVTI